MTIKTGFVATKSVNGETQPDFAAEKTAGNTQIGKIIIAMNELLTRNGVKGTGGSVGVYDPQVLGEAAFVMCQGNLSHISAYGFGMTKQYFETMKLV